VPFVLSVQSLRETQSVCISELITRSVPDGSFRSQFLSHGGFTPQPHGQLPSKGRRHGIQEGSSCVGFSGGWSQDLQACAGREQVDVPAVVLPVGAVVSEDNLRRLTSLSSAENKGVPLESNLLPECEVGRGIVQSPDVPVPGRLRTTLYFILAFIGRTRIRVSLREQQIPFSQCIALFRCC
jgi:hypothetical protein